MDADGDFPWNPLESFGVGVEKRTLRSLSRGSLLRRDTFLSDYSDSFLMEFIEINGIGAFCNKDIHNSHHH